MFFLQNPALATFVPSNRCGQSANNVGAANGICSEYLNTLSQKQKKGKEKTTFEFQTKAP